MRTPPSRPPVRDHGPRRVSRLLVHVEAVDRLQETVNGREFLSVVYLMYKLEIWGLRQARKHDV